MVTAEQEAWDFFWTGLKWRIAGLKCSIDAPCPNGRPSGICCVSCPDYWRDCTVPCPKAVSYTIGAKVCPDAKGRLRAKLMGMKP